MDEEKSPRDKLDCVSNAYRIINNSIKFCIGKTTESGTDEIVDILVYIVIKAKLKRIFSNIQ